MTPRDWKALARPAVYSRRLELAELPTADDYMRPARLVAPSVPEEVYHRMRALQALVERAPLADWMLPAVLPSAANLREHHYARASRTKKARAAAFNSVPPSLRGAFLKPTPPKGLVVLMVRQAPRLIDSDNCATALKGHRDGIADALGVNDRDARVVWETAQERCSTPTLRVVVVGL